MRIKLDYGDRLAFSTIKTTQTAYRALVVKINGKAFNAWRTLEAEEMYIRDERYMQEIDAMLVMSMERMLTKVLEDACAAVPEGVDLLANGFQAKSTDS